MKEKKRTPGDVSFDLVRRWLWQPNDFKKNQDTNDQTVPLNLLNSSPVHNYVRV